MADAARLERARCDLDFEPPDLERFPALALGLEVARAGGTAGAVLNAANEAAVAEFLDGELHFTEIVPRLPGRVGTTSFRPRPVARAIARARPLGSPGGDALGLYLIGCRRFESGTCCW